MRIKEGSVDIKCSGVSVLSFYKDSLLEFMEVNRQKKITVNYGRLTGKIQAQRKPLIISCVLRNLSPKGLSFTLMCLWRDANSKSKKGKLTLLITLSKKNAVSAGQRIVSAEKSGRSTILRRFFVDLD